MRSGAVVQRHSNLGVLESYLAILASVMLLVAARTCWKKVVSHTVILLAVAFAITGVLLLVLREDRYSSWSDFIWRTL